MSINEIFQNPTVKQVIFEIRFPNLFFLENKIGEFQQKIMTMFPDSQLIFRKQLIFADLGPERKVEEVIEKDSSENQIKIWKFTSKNKYELNVSFASLSINSKFHKTYKNPKSDNKFRDCIEFVLAQFREVVQIPFVKRVGLRYIDECPVLEKKTEEFKKWYKTTFPLNRFSIEDTANFNFTAHVNKGIYFLRFAESFNDEAGNIKYILDYDGHSKNVQYENILNVTDELYKIVSDEYENSINSPLYDYMRQGGN